MTPKLCKCGAIVDGRCERCCKTRVDGRSSHERGYDWQWRRLSERYRDNNPLCELCFMQGKTEPATSVHHVVSIEQDASRRLDATNLISVCESCHKQVEGKPDPRITQNV